MDVPEHLRPVIQELSNTTALKDYLEKNKGDLRDVVLKYFSDLGKSLGFLSLETAPLLRYSTTIGNIDCVWRDSDHLLLGLNIVFGSRDEALSAIFKLVELSPSIGVLVISSKSTSSFTIASLSSVLKYSPILSSSKPFMIIDINTGATEVISRGYEQPFQQQRRKVIVGTRPKLQD